ncbi:dipeptidase [Desulfitibacter alkalitolerans]|uniref:dipeptidase n=1 Tax=Desulfitibacter alkalitolerans TaxID=264641 RepID=UPI000553F6FC|nr:dipeptidase [Desulfitibacter alkalitolerans]
MNLFKIVDSHCDTLLKINSGETNFFKNGSSHVDLPKMINGGVFIQFMAVYVHQHYKPGLSLRRCLELINTFLEIASGPQLIHIKNKEDIGRLLSSEKKIGLLLSLEGAEPIENMAILDIFFHLGIRCIGITWNNRNMLADGCNETGGLTLFGKEVISKMSDLGILCDVSHLSQASFWDVIQITRKPIIASHSNCHALCHHPRNLNDSQIKELAQTGGVICITFYPDFIGLNHDLVSIIKHIAHVCELVGVEHVGIGSDFDGAEFSIANLEDSSKLTNLVKGLKKSGFHNQEIEKIMGNNIINLLKNTLPGGNYGS